MKAIDVIQKADMLEPNQYSVSQKLAWLSELDGQIYGEIGEAYEPGWKEPDRYVTGEEELLLSFPYGEGIYRSFIKAMIALENFETAKYNENLEMFDSLYGQYRDRLLRMRRHRNTGKIFRF